MSDDALPVGISPIDAYRAIRAWYQANTDRIALDPDRGGPAAAAKPYVDGMPAAEVATNEQMTDAFRRVLTRDLEWAYHDSDGSYKMAAYAQAACETAGIRPFG